MVSDDIVAGITLAAYAIPVSLAYAGLAGLPLQAGVYGYLLGGLGYAFLGSSRQLAVGPTSAISLMIAATVAEMAGGDAQRYVQIASLTGFTVATLCLVAWVLRLSVLVRLISDSILVGFKAGAALAIAITQLPSLLGVVGGGQNFFERALLLAAQIANTHFVVLAVSVIAVMLLLIGDRHLPGKPVALAVVVLSIIVASVVGLPSLGVPTTGVIPAGLPTLQGPELRLRDVEGIFLLPLGVCCSPTSKVSPPPAPFAAKHGYAVDARQEFLGLLARQISRPPRSATPTPWPGGLSQTGRQRQGRSARTPLALVVCLDHAGALPAVSHRTYLENLPKAVLAAVVLVRRVRPSSILSGAGSACGGSAGSTFYAAAIALGCRAAARHLCRGSSSQRWRHGY